MQINELTKEQLVPQYLMHSYLYYIEGVSVISDRSYDILCKRLMDEWDDVEHPHKHYVNYEALSSGTGFYLKREDYPKICSITAKMWFKDVQKEGGQ